ncbi:hypothetical protein C5167_045037 [Papaver somniferum]|uniref:Uncharacterized protein n=1 Tax=Papaver somniferum TaxID=3469 RepID=A0A4Y7LC44_PAPSO|nr:hypothetical protein C5167_045037 [Papaver somniferum]
MSTPPIHEKEQYSEPDWMKWATDPRSIGCNQVDYKFPHPYGRTPIYPPWELKVPHPHPYFRDFLSSTRSFNPPRNTSRSFNLLRNTSSSLNPLRNMRRNIFTSLLGTTKLSFSSLFLPPQKKG